MNNPVAKIGDHSDNARTCVTCGTWDGENFVIDVGVIEVGVIKTRVIDVGVVGFGNFGNTLTAHLENASKVRNKGASGIDI